MKIAIASPPLPKSIDDCLYWTEKLVKEAAEKQVEIICFPESYIPGYPLTTFDPLERSFEKLKSALDKVCEIAAMYSLNIIMPMDWKLPAGLSNLAFVISSTGAVLGYQTKNQLDPTEDHLWVPGTERAIFEVNGVRFGITICHEGFRYPESVRWAARQGAKIVFHPHCAGSNIEGPKLTEWGNRDNPYYEKAMMMRALENTIYFASSNYCFIYPESASAIVAPDGTCTAHETYGNAGVIVSDIDLSFATGLLAKRYKSELYTGE
ncbi:putative amidohydrolase [Arcticibacter tournemirensis]|uniref:Carbon-nitrogen hydrolase family protein n=1 Tax=Arcticibacter tournemirensis TaxID=699437 RepID=A0A5M9GYE6_9SPHI|nr:carbon-nitrogen hydrolase family protein [Arcticibacter tournemirensis]KAA8479722.1 carbon-nitrogen hydrolase family protein [Arcticibacter tournemirensis]TQM50250.1 putative amidohydrolase [Arcticibacter tournemirensis]